MNQEKINQAVQKLIQADEAYYNTGHSTMEDQEYDSLRAFVKQNDPDHPYFDRVGNKPSSLWKKATHEIPMGSLEKVHTEEDFLKWAGKFGEDEVFISQPKVDGLSLEQLFDQGQFVQAITRGDGQVGEDITPNVALMSGFRTPELNVNEVMHPEIDLKGPYSTRCEVILPKKDLERINSTITEKKDQYKNCRNASSGISRRLDGKFCKYLALKYYDILLSTPLDENEKMDILKGMLLPTVPYYVGNGGHMVTLYNKLKGMRESLPYGIDGMVIKINSWKKQQELGVVKGRPKGQIAWKFDPPSAATLLLSVTWEVGRTGVITPLGHVEPVEIDGSLISKVTLHNIAQIRKLGIGIDDTIMLLKAGDIIPFVEKVIDPIYICPECGFKGPYKQQEEYHVKK
jgi:DNA ligase (NAD+)